MGMSSNTALIAIATIINTMVDTAVRIPTLRTGHSVTNEMESSAQTSSRKTTSFLESMLMR